MRMLQRDFDVETRYGGGFVQEIDGIAGGREDGRPVDWFYYVNGIDGRGRRRRRQGRRRRPDLVGPPRLGRVAATSARSSASFPEPFSSGVDGKRLPVRIDCADDADDVCDEVAERLSADGIEAGRSAAEGFGGEGVLRIMVGPWAQIRRDAAVRQLEEGPRACGVFAKPTPSGSEIAAARRPRGRSSARSAPAAG